MSRTHDLALTHLEYALMHNAGFVALTGEIGAGKTTLLKYVFRRMPEQIEAAFIFNTNLNADAFLQILAKEFEVQPASSQKADLFEALYEHFLKCYAEDRRCLIVVDEAQNLPLETFEELRMLSNLEADSEFLIQIILVGQPEMRRRLTDPALAQLTQRISVHYHLSPLSRDEVSEYIAHRLKTAGREDPKSLFPQETVDIVARITEGIPRLINAFCDACLTYAYGEALHQVPPEIAQQVLEDNPFLWNTADSKSSAQEEHPSDVCPPERTLEEAHVHRILADLQVRLETVERRLSLIETEGLEKTVELLHQMLLDERKKNRELENTIFALKQLIVRMKKQQKEDALRNV